jgi:ParB/RepB/Spo0J family partition protein
MAVVELHYFFRLNLSRGKREVATLWRDFKKTKAEVIRGIEKTAGGKSMTTAVELKTAAVKGPTPEGPKQETTPRASDLQHISVSLIVPSRNNPRKTRNPAKDTELLESIRTGEVWQPIVLRPRKATAEDVKAWEAALKSIKVGSSAIFGPGDPIHEIVAGHRRWEASIQAGKLTIPAVIRNLSDEQALEVTIIENLQREDIDPLDEGAGFAALRKLDPKKYTIEYMAERTKKGPRGPRYVYQAMQRDNLIPELKVHFRSGNISASHVDLLCRLTASGQMNALKEGLFDWNKETRSVRELDQWIKQRIHLQLDAAPWKKDDPNLVPKAGACSNCQKNTTVNPHLDPDAKRATCTDPSCYQEKKQAHLIQIEKTIAASGEKVLRLGGDYNLAPTKNNDFVRYGTWGEVKANSCKSATAAVVVNGARAGQRVVACADSKCKVHRQFNHSPARSRMGGSAGRVASSAAALKEKQNEEIKKQGDVAVLSAIAQKAKIDRWFLTAIALQIQDFGCGYELLEPFAQKHLSLPAPKREHYSSAELQQIIRSRGSKLKDAELAALIVASLADDYSSTASMLQLDRVASHYKVDVAKIRKGVRAQIEDAARKTVTLPKQKPAMSKTKMKLKK